MKVPKDKEEHVKALKTIKRLFEEHNITYWLDLGTTLGSYREGKIIDWDYDVDVAVWVEDYPKITKLRKDFREAGFELRTNKNHAQYQLWVKDKKWEGRAWHRACILAHGNIKGYTARLHFIPFARLLYYLNKRKTDNWDNLIAFFWSLIVKFKLYNDLFCNLPVEDMQEFTTGKIFNEEYPVPKNTLDYIKIYFGESWNVPLKLRTPEAGIYDTEEGSKKLRIRVDEMIRRKKEENMKK